MRSLQIVAIAACLFSVPAAFGAGAKQCEKYATVCKADATIKAMPKTSKLAAIDKCIMSGAVADGATGAACVKEQSGRRANQAAPSPGTGIQK